MSWAGIEFRWVAFAVWAGSLPVALGMQRDWDFWTILLVLIWVGIASGTAVYLDRLK